MTTKVKHIANNVVTDSHIDLSTIDSGEIAEGSNLYFTDARVDSRLSGGSVGNIASTGSITTSSSSGYAISNIGRLKMNSNNLYLETFTNGTGVVLNSRTGFVTFQNNGATSFQMNSSNNATFQGDVTVLGKLNLQGDLDSYNVTDLDVTDKTITLGSGQAEAVSGGSGIIVDGSAASILWDESTDLWDFNKGIEVLGNIHISAGGGQRYIELASGTSGAKTWRFYNGISWNPDALLIYDHTSDATAVTIEPGKLGINRGANSLSQTLEVGGGAVIDANLGVGKTPGSVRVDVLTPLSGNLAGMFTNTHATGSYGVKIQAGSSSSNYGFQVANKDDSVDHLTVLGNGNVGIGISSNIDSKLHVVDGTAQINIESTSGDATLKLESTGNSYWNIFNDQSDARKLKFEDNGNGVALTVERTGNVGIGTTNPTTHLSVTNSGFTNTSTGGIPAIRAEGSYGGAIGLLDGTKEAGWYAQDSGDTLYQYVGRSNGTAANASIVMTYKSSGNVGIGESIPTEKLHDGGNIKMQASTAHVIYQNAANTWNVGLDAADPSFKFKDGTDERMRINSSGDWMVSNTVANIASNYSSQGGCGWVESDNHFEIATTSNRSAIEIGKNNATSGAIITIRQQGNSIGMIGTEGGDSLVIQSNGSTGVGLRFHPTTGNIDPVRNGVRVDNTVSIGTGTHRFKDLILSGVIQAGGKVTASSGAYLGDDDVFQDTADNFVGGLVLETPIYKEYQYRWSGQNDHETNVYVPSYFMSEIVFTQHQTNGGTDINRHFVGKFANNHTHHELETIHDSGGTWSMTTTMTATDHNLNASGGGSSANGRLRIVENYGSGSYNSSTLTIRVYFGTISNITHTYG